MDKEKENTWFSSLENSVGIFPSSLYRWLPALPQPSHWSEIYFLLCSKKGLYLPIWQKIFPLSSVMLSNIGNQPQHLTSVQGMFAANQSTKPRWTQRKKKRVKRKEERREKFTGDVKFPNFTKHGFQSYTHTCICLGFSPFFSSGKSGYNLWSLSQHFSE